MPKREEAKEFADLLLATAETFDKKLSDAAIEIYWQVLKNLSIEEFRYGLMAHLEDSERGRFMPRPADILHFAHPKRTALVAWAEVVEAMDRYGAYQSVKFADTIAAAVVRDMGGWPLMCNLDIIEPWTQKEFERRYENYALIGIHCDDKLPGLIEMNNTERNFLGFIEPPKEIGIRSNLLLGPWPNKPDKGAA